MKSIVEQKDATRAQLRLREGNTGVLVAPARLLRAWLGKLRTNNAQGEFYLTDVIAMAVKERIGGRGAGGRRSSRKCWASMTGCSWRSWRPRCASSARMQLMRAGVTLADPLRFDQRGELIVGRDVFIDVNVVFEGQVQLGDRVRIGSNCVLRNVSLGAGTQVHANSVLDGATAGTGLRHRSVCAVSTGHDAGRRRAHREFRRGEEQQHRRRLQGQSPDLSGRCHAWAQASTSGRARSPATTMARTRCAPSSRTVRSSVPATCWWRR